MNLFKTEGFMFTVHNTEILQVIKFYLNKYKLLILPNKAKHRIVSGFFLLKFTWSLQNKRNLKGSIGVLLSAARASMCTGGNVLVVTE